MQRLAGQFEGQQVLTIFRGNHPRYPQASAAGEVGQACVLGLQFLAGVVTMADFQHESALVTVDPVIEVLLAAQRLQGSRESVMLLEQLQRLRHRDIRARQTGTADQRGE